MQTREVLRVNPTRGVTPKRGTVVPKHPFGSTGVRERVFLSGKTKTTTPTIIQECLDRAFIKLFVICLLIASFSVSFAGIEKIDISDQKMSLTAVKVPLRDILVKIHQSGIRVKIDPDFNPVITAQFIDKEMSAAFRDLLKDANYALIWGKNKAGDMRVSEVIIYRPGRMDSARLFKPPDTLDIEKNSDTGDIYVKNRLLVQFHTKEALETLQTVITKLGASIKLIHKILGLYEITLPGNVGVEQALALLETFPVSATIEPDYAYRSFEPVYQAGDGFADQAPAADGDIPDSFAVAVLDTGLMQGQLPDWVNQASFDVFSPGEEITDPEGHGTQMALVASGVVQPAGEDTTVFSNPVISIRAFDGNGYTSNTALIKSIDFAVNNGAKILSLSWGSETKSRFLESAMEYARSRGLIIVAAAGNSPTGKPVYPAAFKTVVSVSALAPDGKAWNRSNYGDFVDLAAPGFARFPVGYKGKPGMYAGTSISTAFVAGKLAAFLRAHPDARLNNLMNSIETGRVNPDTPGKSE